MIRIAFLDRTALAPQTQLRELSIAHRWTYYPTTTPEQVVEHASDADILVLSKVVIDRDTLKACPEVKHIAVAATGYNVIDINACNELGVSVSNIPSYAGTTVPEHVISLALTLRRELIHYRQLVIDGVWQQNEGFCVFDKPVNDLARSTLGIIGFGELGQATAKLAQTLGMRVIFSARRDIESGIAKQVSFDELIETADIISLHCSLNDSTHNLIDQAELERIQNHAILINTARGGIVNEPALVQAIRQKKIGGAGVDVLVEEPPADDSPLLSIAHHSNVIITPHTAWISEQAMQHLADVLIDNIEAHAAGRALNLVTA